MNILLNKKDTKLDETPLQQKVPTKKKDLFENQELVKQKIPNYKRQNFPYVGCLIRKKIKNRATGVTKYNR